MRILIDNSGYHLENLGDVAMLQAAVRRLRLAWPGASLAVITDAPERLERFCPGAQPVQPGGQRLFAHTALFSAPIERLLRRAWAGGAAKARAALQQRARFTPGGRGRGRGEPPEPLEAFVEEVRAADLLLAAGGGYITDPFSHHASGILATLNLGLSFGKPVAMVGQAIGPVSDPWLWHFAAATLRRLPLILLREAAMSMPILRRMGVPLERTFVTGDDALEMAFARRAALPGGPGAPGVPGVGIGFNVRVATYSGVGPQAAQDMAEGVIRVAALRGLEVKPIAISLNAVDSDAQSLARLGLEMDERLDELSPDDVMARIAQCRVVVTGSYHAAVFALGQGIPVVGLTHSRYYDAKFAGLAGMFGEASCRAVSVAEAGSALRIAEALTAALDAADRVRPALLEAAQRQVAAGLEGYRRLAGLV